MIINHHHSNVAECPHLIELLLLRFRLSSITITFYRILIRISIFITSASTILLRRMNVRNIPMQAKCANGMIRRKVFIQFIQFENFFVFLFPFFLFCFQFVHLFDTENNKTHIFYFSPSTRVELGMCNRSRNDYIPET